MWVLIVGVNPGGYAPGSGTQYFIGQFDGITFTNANEPATELWLDYGRDYYAAQTFFDREIGQPTIAMAWASNWHYAGQTPTTAFRGVFSLPRELRLVDTPDGLRVAASVPQYVSEPFDHLRLGDAPVVPRTGTYRLTGPIRLQPGEESELALFAESQPQMIFRRSDDGQVALRLVRAPRDGMREFAHDYDVPIGGLDAVDIEIFVDNGLVELSVDGGRVWVTNLYFPADVAGAVTVT
jgi:fructan beta-fructosidase